MPKKKITARKSCGGMAPRVPTKVRKLKPPVDSNLPRRQSARKRTGGNQQAAFKEAHASDIDQSDEDNSEYSTRVEVVEENLPKKTQPVKVKLMTARKCTGGKAPRTVLARLELQVDKSESDEYDSDVIEIDELITEADTKNHIDEPLKKQSAFEKIDASDISESDKDEYITKAAVSKENVGEVKKKFQSARKHTGGWAQHVKISAAADESADESDDSYYSDGSEPKTKRTKEDDVQVEFQGKQ